MVKLSREEKKEQIKKRRSERADKRESSGTFKHLLDTSDYDKVEFFSLKDGKNYIDILPYEVSSKSHPDKIPIGEDDYKLEVWQHENIGVNDDKILCLKKTYGKKCPICEEQRRLLDGGDDWNDAGPKALRPKFRVYYNMIDLSESAETDDIQIFETTGAEKWFDDLLEKESKAGEETIAFYDIEDGMTVVCRATEDTFNKRKFNRPERIDFEEREQGYDEDIYDEVYPLDAMLKIPTYEEVAKIFLELEDEDVEKSTSRKKKEKAADEPEKKTRKKKQKKEEPKEDEDSGSAGDCPYGHTFGIDFQNTDACKDCEEDKFESCGDESDRLKALEKEDDFTPPKEEKKEKKRRRRR